MNWQHIADFFIGTSVVFIIRIIWLEKKVQKEQRNVRQIIGYNRFLLKLLVEAEERARKAAETPNWNVTERQ